MSNQSFNESLSHHVGDDDSFNQPSAARSADEIDMAAHALAALDQQLQKTITSEIIPRMFLVLKTGKALDQSGPSSSHAIQPTQDQIEELAHLLLMPSADTSRRYVEQLHLQGMSMDAIYLQLLAPTANYFGELWAQDVRDFTEVTTALSRLHAIVRRLGPSFRASETRCETYSTQDWSLGMGSSKRALICPMPGEQHTFGCVIVGDYFKRDGWDVTAWPPSSQIDLLDTVRLNYFDLVGLSVSCSTSLENVAGLISAIRRLSMNPAIVILAGGNAFFNNPQHALDLGADATGSNGNDAVLAANTAFNQLAERLLP